MATKIKSAATPADRIVSLTSELSRLREQRDLTHAAPRSLDEARADIQRTVELLAARVDLPVGYLAGGPSGYADLAHVMGANLPDWPQLTPMTVLAWAAPQALATALERSLVATYEGLPVSMDAATKAAELKRLNDQIRAVESEISSVWWGAADSGLQLAPPDISGSILIGLQ